MIEAIKKIFDFILHIDVHLTEIVSNYGTLTYVVLFLVVFCETGLVVTPFLPGDSLFFAAGAISASSGLNVVLTIVVCMVAAIVGNTVNFAIGKRVGPAIFNKESRFIKKEYLEKTKAFYDKHGTKAIVLSRLLAIFRTFVPFIAGIAGMNPFKHLVYNIVGAVLWVNIFVLGGYFFGSIPFVQNNFSLVIIGILVVTVLPAVITVIKAKFFPDKEVL